MVLFFPIASVLAAASTALAGYIRPTAGNCNVTAAKPNLPSNQTNVTLPAGQSVQKIALGVGVQNYSCSAAGTYSSIGAVATLFDISCLYGNADIASLPKFAYNIWNSVPNNTLSKVEEYCAQNSYPVYADHYFQTNPSGSGISPVFDARSTSHKGDPNAYVLANKTGDLLSPAGTQNIDWLQLTGVQGSLAKTVLRVDTQHGQPPSSCTPGSASISVKYTANYYFYT